MRLNRHTIKPALAAVAVVGSAWVCSVASAQSNEALELLEAKTALQISHQQIKSLEGSLQQAKEQSRHLSESLANANLDLQDAREAYERIRIQLEGLGLSALDSGTGVVQQRLLVALSDLRILESQKRQLTAALFALTESSLAYSQSGSVNAKESLDSALAASDKALSQLQNTQEENNDADYHNASVVSIKQDLGIAVFNIGARHGVHPGMPFTIYRQDKPVGRALVVDVRSGICGAVVQELVNPDESIKVGDTAKVEAIKG